MCYAGDEVYDDEVTSGPARDWDDHLDDLDRSYDADDDWFEDEIDTAPITLAAWTDRVD